MGSIARAGWCWRRGRGWGTAPPMINDGGAPAGGVGRGDPAGRPYQYGGSPLPIRRVAPTTTTTMTMTTTITTTAGIAWQPAGG